MEDSTHQFVADDLWLVIAVFTLPLAGLAGFLNLPTVAGVIAIVGWFLLTPLFLFWGKQVVAFYHPAQSREGEETAGDADDPIYILQQRYARGEIDETELEHRLDRLVAMDDNRGRGPDTRYELEKR